MKGTNKQVLAEASRRLMEINRNREERLEALKTKGLEDGEYQKASEQIISEFNQEIVDVESMPGYKEARQAALDVLGAKVDVYEAQTKLKEAKKAYMSKVAILRGEKIEAKVDEKVVEMMGYKGKEVHITVPAVGKFPGLEFDYFVSDDKVSTEAFESNPKLKEKSYSGGEILKLLNSMAKYEAEYEDNPCEGYYFRRITKLKDSYWTSDISDELSESSPILCYYENGQYNFMPVKWGAATAHLFLKMSD